MTEQELKRYDTYRSTREAFSGGETSKVEFQDPQMQKALEWIRARLGNQ